MRSCNAPVEVKERTMSGLIYYYVVLDVFLEIMFLGCFDKISCFDEPDMSRCTVLASAQVCKVIRTPPSFAAEHNDERLSLVSSLLPLAFWQLLPRIVCVFNTVCKLL